MKISTQSFTWDELNSPLSIEILEFSAIIASMISAGATSESTTVVFKKLHCNDVNNPAPKSKVMYQTTIEGVLTEIQCHSNHFPLPDGKTFAEFITAAEALLATDAGVSLITELWSIDI